MNLHPNKEIKVIDESQEQLGEINFEARCHIFFTGKNVSICGSVTRRENPVHRPSLGNGGYQKMPYCPYDGLKHCEKCRQVK